MQTADFRWPQAGPPLLMGILNVTPDSFSDGGRFRQRDEALRHAEQMLREGAAIIDIGGESTRPGAQAVSPAEELERILPVIEAVLSLGAVVSVDTRHAEVMRVALAAGAHIINDVSALAADGAVAAVTAANAAVCLMHMQGEPRSMQHQPHYDEVVTEVAAFLRERAQACLAAGLARDKICLDPGFGFGKTAEHNLRLLQALPTLCAEGFPVLAGLSRKSLIGQITGAPVGERLAGSVALALLAAQRGARVLRVHDVNATRQVMQLWLAMEACGQ